MVKIDDDFTQAVLKDEDKYEGKDLDANIAAALPEGAEIEWVCTHGATHWSVSTKIDTRVDGKPTSFFLKEYRDANAKDMVRAEYESTAALHETAPQNVPRPLAYGSFASDPERFFYIQAFCDMNDELPDVDEFVAILAKIHQKKSPTGKFGFHITTFQGNIPNHNEWCDTWEEYFTRNLISIIDLERQIHGADPEMDALSSDIVKKVVPRLLRPLETGGNKIEPVLMHGDMWHGNVSVDNETDEPILYDAGSFYGHNEYEANPWRATRYQFNRTHLRAYHKLVPVSKPAEDHDDRNALYAVAIEGMRRLVAKFPDGYEGYVATSEARGKRDSGKFAEDV
ncbi:hypothetical protein J4E80_010039 [Alternaria sp. BMP 0032]|nr:hypothetical protein J4E80_010039 [Alternaria sp. BMP 0032]